MIPKRLRSLLAAAAGLAALLFVPLHLAEAHYGPEAGEHEEHGHEDSDHETLIGRGPADLPASTLLAPAPSAVAPGAPVPTPASCRAGRRPDRFHDPPPSSPFDSAPAPPRAPPAPRV